MERDVRDAPVNVYEAFSETFKYLFSVILNLLITTHNYSDLVAYGI